MEVSNVESHISLVSRGSLCGELEDDAVQIGLPQVVLCSRVVGHSKSVLNIRCNHTWK